MNNIINKRRIWTVVSLVLVVLLLLMLRATPASALPGDSIGPQSGPVSQRHIPEQRSTEGCYTVVVPSVPNRYMGAVDGNGQPVFACDDGQLITPTPTEFEKFAVGCGLSGAWNIKEGGWGVAKGVIQCVIGGIVAAG